MLFDLCTGVRFRSLAFDLIYCSLIGYFHSAEYILKSYLEGCYATLCITGNRNDIVKHLTSHIEVVCYLRRLFHNAYVAAIIRSQF